MSKSTFAFSTNDDSVLADIVRLQASKHNKTISEYLRYCVWLEAGLELDELEMKKQKILRDKQEETMVLQKKNLLDKLNAKHIPD